MFNHLHVPLRAPEKQDPMRYGLPLANTNPPRADAARRAAFVRRLEEVLGGEWPAAAEE